MFTWLLALAALLIIKTESLHSTFYVSRFKPTIPRLVVEISDEFSNPRFTKKCATTYLITGSGGVAQISLQGRQLLLEMRKNESFEGVVGRFLQRRVKFLRRHAPTLRPRKIRETAHPPPVIPLSCYIYIYIIFIENRKLYLRWSRKAQRTKERTKEGRKEGRKKRIRLISRLSRATIVYGQAWLPDVTFLERMRACYALCRYTYTHCMYVRSLNISSIVSAILCQISARNGIFTEEISYLNFETIIVETKPRLNVRPCFFFLHREKCTLVSANLR